MIYDGHIHTKYSADSNMQLADALAAAKKQNIGLVLTEHFDPDYPGEEIFDFDPAAYWREYSPFRGDSLDSGLSLGIEMGLQPKVKEAVIAFLAGAPFDQVIGSIHLVDGEDIYEADYYEGREQDEVYTRYFEVMAAMVRQHSYIDTLGHIDYICRAATYAEPGINYPRYASFIDDVLRALVETDTAIEVNTRRFSDRLAIKELVPVYRRFRELGGRYATIGSDAHRPAAVGAYVPAAWELIQEVGLVPVTFRERRRVEMKAAS